MKNGSKEGPKVVFLTIIGSLLLIVIFLLWHSRPVNPTAYDKTASPSAQSGDWVGRKAPDFELEDFDGHKVSLASLKGKDVVLFFTEGLMCYPACWDQMAQLGTDSRFNNENVTSYSVIVDGKNDWQKAFEKMPQLRQTKVLFDGYRTASRSYGALNVASSMHRGSFPGHTYFLIDKEGVIRYFLDDPQMGVRNDQLFAELQKILR